MELEKHNIYEYSDKNDKDIIFKELLDSIYLEDIDNFKNIISENVELISYEYKEHYLVHYLFDNYWEDGINFYYSVGGKFDYLTKDSIISFNNIPVYVTGGQNCFHILARKNKNKYTELATNLPYLLLSDFMIHDFNGDTPDDLIKIKNNFDIFKKNYYKILDRNYIKFDHVIPINLLEKNVINYHITQFTVENSLIKEIKEIIDIIDINIPNSMHRYGKIIYPQAKLYIDKIIKSLIKVDNIINIHAFYIKYNNDLQKNLDKHVDDSTYTINLCLSNTSDQGELIFDDLNLTYIHKPNQGILHYGKIMHHCNDIGSGQRENIIIWINCI